MKAEGVHDPVHEERGPRHVAGVLHQGDEEIEDEDARHEGEHRADAAEHSVSNHVAERPLRHLSPEPGAERGYPVLYPLLRIGPEDECGLEHEEHEDEEYRVAPEAVRQQIIDPHRA